MVTLNISSSVIGQGSDARPFILSSKHGAQVLIPDQKGIILIFAQCNVATKHPIKSYIDLTISFQTVFTMGSERKKNPTECTKKCYNKNLTNRLWLIWNVNKQNCNGRVQKDVNRVMTPHSWRVREWEQWGWGNKCHRHIAPPPVLIK